MANAPERDEYDIFLSHATPDKAWVLALAERLETLGIRVFVDALEIDPGDNWLVRLSDALERSRYMGLVLSEHTESRPWVMQEWTAFVASHGPLGRLLPVKIDAVALPAILSSTQAIDGTRRDVEQVGQALFEVVGDPSALPPDDDRLLVPGRDRVFTLSRDEEQLSIVPPSAKTRQVRLPWKQDTRFGVALLEFSKLHQRPVSEAHDRASLFRHAGTLGDTLFDLLFDEPDAQQLAALTGPDRPRPVIQIRSDDDLLLSLPWELLRHEDRFLVREGDVDLVRTTPTDVAGVTLLKAPEAAFKGVVNVSAPEGSGLRYEAESYRITLATAERCTMVPTELGTLEDLVETVYRESPTGIHFSGHGKPGALLFENDEGRDDVVDVAEVIEALRRRLPDNRRLPPFFYLASCHGNEPSRPEDDEPSAPSAAVQLHKAGVTEVVGYFGPIVDELSTRAEEALYEAIAEGLPTRDAVRRARQALTQSFHDLEGRHRPGAMLSLARDGLGQDQEVALDTHPFAWAQLAFCRRGAEWPLSVETPAGKRRKPKTLKRDFKSFGDRRVLSTGFIGRRSEQHKVRRRIREGQRVFVFQGLGGLGKSTLAQHVLPWLTEDSDDICTLWCQEVEGEASRAEALVGQLLHYCRTRFGLGWEQVVQAVDQAAGDDSAKRFVYFLHALAQHASGLVLYLDNLESLLVGPTDDTDAGAFGKWAEPALEAIWCNAEQMARDADALYLVASCRYRNDAFANALLPVSPLPRDALFRLTDWFAALQRLTVHAQAKLVSRLDGHPRAVEYANDLVADALTKWRDTEGEWALPVPPSPKDLEREWAELVEPALPRVAEQLRDNLLLEAIWERVLDERARRFLYRMTVLRRPVEWSLLALLGESDEPEERALATADRLRDTSLLEQSEVLSRTDPEHTATFARYALHPSTAKFIAETHGDAPALRQETHRRLGEHLEAETRHTPYVETYIEAGFHLFEAEQYNSSYQLLGGASVWLNDHGRAREASRLLEPFLDDAVHERMDRALTGLLLSAVGNACVNLGEFEKAIGYHEQHLTIARETADRQGEGAALGSLGIAYDRLGDLEHAIGYHEQALVISRETGDRRGEGRDLGNLGIAHARVGEIGKAVGYFAQHLAIAQEVGDRQGEGNALGNLGNAYADLGEIEKAAGYFEQGLAIARESGDQQGEGISLGNLGSAYARLGEVERAVSYFDQRLVIAREIGDRQGEGIVLGNLGNAYADLGEVEKAIGYHEQALVISRETGDRRGECNGLGKLGNAHANLGELEKAIGYYEQQLVITRGLGDRRGEGNGLNNLGIAYASLGEFEKAVGYFEQQLVISREIGDRHGQVAGLVNLGGAYASLGEIEKATSLLQQAKAIGEQIGDPQVVQAVTQALENLPKPKYPGRYCATPSM